MATKDTKDTKEMAGGHGATAPGGVFTEENLRRLMEQVKTGEMLAEEAVAALKALPFEEVAGGGCATLDHHRELRTGFSEVIFCAGKTTEQVAEIAARVAAVSGRLLGTRASLEQFEAARKRVPELHFNEIARAFWMDRDTAPKAEGVVIVAAGTSDLPVAEEAAVTLEVMGHRAKRITDVGVAGLHRLLARVGELQEANVIVAIAGMEGAMPSVIAGLVATPVIAVPTSVGYGANFGGVAALLAMLNSCASGLSVVNIDNGFGAAFMAAAVNAKCVAAGRRSHRQTQTDTDKNGN
jgi:pyridinium-3,5-biscarboxylic acid mononucleotide synthase